MKKNSKFSVRNRIWTTIAVLTAFFGVAIVATFFLVPSENLPIGVLLAAFCVFAGLAFASGWWLNKSLKVSIDEVNLYLRRISLGDLSLDISDAPSNEFDETLIHIEEIVANLLTMQVASDEFLTGAKPSPFFPVSEFDKFGISFKKLVETSRQLAGSKQQNTLSDTLVESLTNDVSLARKGELRGEIQSSNESLKPIARMFSQLINETNELVFRIKSANIQADSSAQETQTISESLGQNGFILEQGLIQADFKARELVGSSKIVFERLSESKELALNSLARTKQGSAATQNAINAMVRLRHQIQESMNHIKRFSERSSEIKNIAKSIDDLSHRTGIVALNASIQASSSNEGNRGFVAVAEEIESLAERSSEATKQISTLTTALQNETNEALESLENVGREVTNNHQLANTAGQILNELEIMSESFANSTSELNGIVQRQLQKSNEVSRVVSDAISDSQKTIENLKRVAENGNKIVSLTRELGTSVASYRMPQNPRATVNQPPTENFSTVSNSLN